MTLISDGVFHQITDPGWHEIGRYPGCCHQLDRDCDQPVALISGIDPSGFRSILLMKNFQKELLSISTSISKLAIELETLANDIDGQSIEKKPAESLASSKAMAGEAT